MFTYQLPPRNGKRTDPMPLDGMSVFQRLEADFNRKRGLGVPVSLMLHSEYLMKP